MIHIDDAWPGKTDYDSFVVSPKHLQRSPIVREAVFVLTPDAPYKGCEHCAFGEYGKKLCERHSCAGGIWLHEADAVPYALEQ